MSNFLIPDDPVFSDAIRQIETEDAVHANIVNPMFRTLLINTVFLKKMCDTLSENLAKAQTDNTYGGKNLSAEANIQETDAQFPVLKKVSSTASQVSLFNLSISNEDIRKGLYSLIIRMKVSKINDSSGLLNIKVKSNGLVLEERTITASMFESENKYQMLGFNVEVVGPFTIEAILLANSANITTCIDYVMLQPTHTTITSL